MTQLVKCASLGLSYEVKEGEISECDIIGCRELDPSENVALPQKKEDEEKKHVCSGWCMCM